MNRIVAENALPGSPPEQWDVVGAGDFGIQGFATQMSVDVGTTVEFKVETDASAYRLDVYRLGWYGGDGARLVATVTPHIPLPHLQPPPAVDDSTGLLDCGTWDVCASWDVPADATSGIHVAKLVREDGTEQSSHIVFVVRDDQRDTDVLIQTSDTTWQAYNSFGDRSLYEFLTTTGTRAHKVSYNRPWLTRIAEGGANWLFAAEYAMVRWVEANGYDVSYCAGADVDRDGAMLQRHRVFLSVGHDEYWSADQRVHVEAARDAGTHLAFLSGNEVFWKTRWEPSIDGSDTPYRTLVCYKDTHANAPIDPTGVWTGTWRDPRFSPPLDGGQPENALTGTRFGAQGFTDLRIVVGAEDAQHRIWRDTDLVDLAPGDVAELAVGSLGYEWDVEPEDGRPAGLMHLSSTEIETGALLLDHGSTFGPGVATHHLVLHRAASGALVFGAGTAQWSWGLDGFHDSHDSDPGAPDSRMQQAMVNLFADMGVQPASLQDGLVPATEALEGLPTASSTIDEPTPGTIVVADEPLVVRGRAAASSGAVGAVDVSTDGGATWRAAVGRGEWAFEWTPVGQGRVRLQSRAVDDRGRFEVPVEGVAVEVGGPVDPGPGGPVLVVVDGTHGQVNPLAGYLPEVLRAEGLLVFETVELDEVLHDPDPVGLLRAAAVVVLAETRLSLLAQQVLRTHVESGGRLVALRPDPALADLFGLAFVSPRPQDPLQPRQFFQIDTSASPGAGLTADSLQYHGDADTYDVVGAPRVVAAICDDIDTPSAAPAVVVAEHGAGTAAMFTFDVATSVVLMRQGNPDWSNVEGDGVNLPMPSPTNDYPNGEYRPMDMFCRLDGRLWFEPRRLQVPQADELQRLLANLVLDLAGLPLPRVWYLPAGQRSIVLNTGDGEHYSPSVLQLPMDDALAHGGTFSTYLRREQITNDSSPSIVLDPATEAAWRGAGHEIGVHVHASILGTNVQTPESMRAAYEDIIGALHAQYGHGARTARNHTIDWTGWIDQAVIESDLGTGIDLNYYHYFQFAAADPSRFPELALPRDFSNAHGWFTGSGLAQRFCDAHGRSVPIYQLLTEWSDEFFADNGYPADDVHSVLEQMLDAADAGYVSAFVANIHHGRYAGDDPLTAVWVEDLWHLCQQRGIRMVAAERLLDFLEVRDAVRFVGLDWKSGVLSFAYTAPAAGQEVTLVLPADGLVGVDVDGAPADVTTQTLHGRTQAFMTTTADSAQVEARYAVT